VLRLASVLAVVFGMFQLDSVLSVVLIVLRVTRMC
jgi:hypothetical protein